MQLSRRYNQVATYWGSPVPNGLGGYTFSAPVQMNVRWEDNFQEITSPQGGIIVSKATVWVPQDVDLEGYLYLGDTDVANPQIVPGASKIIGLAKVPDLRALSTEIRAFV